MSATRTILLVEDEASITEPLTAALEREGWATHVTASAREAPGLVTSKEPDLVLLDVMLEDGSGFDVCREIRQTSRVPIIMLTARGEELDRIIGLELGADDYVVKPFSAGELVARMRAITLDPASRIVTKDGETVELAAKVFNSSRSSNVWCSDLAKAVVFFRVRSRESACLNWPVAANPAIFPSTIAASTPPMLVGSPAQ